MIYQLGNEFKLFSFKAKYNGLEEYTDSKEAFEKDLKFRLEMEDRINNPYNALPSLIVLPQITYETLTYTQDQLKRLAECQGTNASIEDVKFYIMEGKFPAGNHSLKIVEVQAKNSSLEAQLAQTNADMVDLMNFIIGGGQ